MMWKVAYRNLFRNRRRTYATGTAIVAGFVGLTLLGAYILRVQNSLKANTVYLNHRGHLSVYKFEGLERFNVRPSQYQISAEEKSKIYEVLANYSDNIEFTGEVLGGSGLLSNGNKSIPFLATGIEPEVEAKIQNHPNVLNWAKDFLVFSGGSFAEVASVNPNAISITPKMGDLLGRNMPFSELNSQDSEFQLAAKNYFGDLNAVNADLKLSHSTGIGFAESTSLWAPLKLLQQLYDTDGIQFLAIYLRSESDINFLKQRLTEDFKKRGLNFDIYRFDNEIVSPTYVGSMSFLNAMAGFFIFLICGAVALSIVNSLTMGILERTKEIGTLRALGFRPYSISWLFAQEALLLSLISIAVGAFISIAIAFYVNRIDIRISPPGLASDVQFILKPHPIWVLLVSSLLTLVAVTTGFLASIFKVKQKVIDLLLDSGA